MAGAGLSIVVVIAPQPQAYLRDVCDGGTEGQLCPEASPAQHRALDSSLPHNRKHSFTKAKRPLSALLRVNVRATGRSRPPNSSPHRMQKLENLLV